MTISIKEAMRIGEGKKKCYDQGFKDGVASKSSEETQNSTSTNKAMSAIALMEKISNEWPLNLGSDDKCSNVCGKIVTDAINEWRKATTS